MKYGSNLDMSQDLMYALLDISSNALLIVDSKGAVQAANALCEQFLGHHYESIIGQTFSELLVAEQQQQFFSLIDTALMLLCEKQANPITNQNTAFELPLQIAIQKPFCSVTITDCVPWRDTKAQRDCVVLSISLAQLHDTILADASTERKIKQAISEASLDTLITINLDDIIIDFNEAGHKMFGWKREEVLGRKMHELFVPPEHQEAHKKGMALYRETLQGPLLGKRIVIDAMHRDGHRVPVELGLVPIDLKDDHYVTAFLRDITELKQSEEALKKESEKARATSAAKSRFLSHMSHEIRSPLNSLLGGVELLGDTLTTEEQSYFYELVQSSGQSLLAIINEILDFSKIESGRVDVFPTMTQVEDLTEKVLQTAVINCPEDVYLFGIIDVDMPSIIEIDANKIRQVMIIFLDNAFKFTHSGMVCLSIKHLDNTQSKSEQPAIQFKISDTGIGIAKREQEHIFSEFEQVDAIRDSGYGGTGLGLTIAKRLIELMGGSIEVTSNQELGTTFNVEIPCKSIKSERTTKKFSKKVGYIGPDACLRLFLEQSLLKCVQSNDETNHGCSQEIIWYDSTLSLEQWLSEHEFDVVATNELLFKKYNLESLISDTTQLLIVPRSHVEFPSFSKPNVKVVKTPVTSTKLLQILHGNPKPNKKIRTTNSSPVAEPLPTAKHLTNKSRRRHILLVDDMVSNRVVAKIALEKRGFEITEAENGLDAIEQLESRPFDLVLMDMRMPKLDGLETSKRIRSSDMPFSEVPIIALTANAEASEKERCLSAGINSFFSKPYKFSALVDEINFLLNV